MNQFAKSRKIAGIDRKAVKTRTSIFTAWNIYSMDGDYLGRVVATPTGYALGNVADTATRYATLALAAMSL